MAPNSPIPLPHGELDLSTAEVRTTSGTHTLSDREVALLQGLAERPGQAIAPDELAAHMGIKTLSSEN